MAQLSGDYADRLRDGKPDRHLGPAHRHVRSTPSRSTGAALPTLTASYTGWANGDTPANLTTLPCLSTSASAGSRAGSYLITVGGAVSGDYAIKYVTGTLSVTPALAPVSDLTIGNGPASVVLAGADASGAALTYSASASVAGVALAILNNVLTVKPPLGYTGTFTVTATVSDGPYSASRTFRVAVLPSSPLLPQGYPAAPFGPAGTDPLTAQVNGLYNLILGRGPDPGGVANSVKYLRTGGSASTLATILLSSTERETNLVQSYYQTFIGRAADPAGLANSVRALQAGMSEATLASILLATPEFSAHHPDNASFVRALYLDVLDRGATPGEVAAWSGLLTSSKADPRAQVASCHRLARPSGPVDLAIEGAYLAVLGRPAAAYEVAAWQPFLTAGSCSIDGLEAALFASPSYAARARAGH